MPRHATQTLIHKADRSEHEGLARSIAAAFYDDPIARYLFPRAGSRNRRLVAFYLWVMEMISAHGAVYADADGHGAAVWQAPQPPKATGLHELRLAASMALRIRTSLFRAAKLNDLVSQAHVREPHWYLAILGTEPAAQGQGIGSALLAPVLRQCDETLVIAYLESSKEANIPFYERHGFRVLAELEVVRGPKLWPMSREPRPLAER